MQILETITDQITGNRLPLVAVTVAAVPCPDTPFILTMHWHGFARERQVDADGSETVALTPVPSTALQVNERWSDLLDLDMAAMEAAWELGAWDVVRSERPGCLRAGARGAEAYDCLRAFGAPPVPYQGAEMVVCSAPDAEELIGVAGHAGYVHWQFRPVHGSVWTEVSDDATLDANGKREPHCPLAPVRPRCDGARRTVYRFGHRKAAT